MTLLTNRTTWEAAAAITLIAGIAAGAVLYLRRKRPTEEEIERARRKMLSQTGRLIDGMLLDIREVTLDDGRPLTMLEYSYRSAGVDYECSQDVTTLLTVVDPTEVRAGFPCTDLSQAGRMAGIQGEAYGLSPYLRFSIATDLTTLQEACARIQRACAALT